MDEAGATLGSAAVGLPISYPNPGWAEQDPHTWLEGVAAVVRRATDDAGIASGSIVALGVATQVDAIVALDARHVPVGPVPIWMDRRATRETDELVKALGVTQIREITGLNADSSHGAPKIMWLRRNVGGDYFVPPAAFIVQWLTGELVMDRAHASSLMLWNVRANEWSSALLDASGLSPEALPTVGVATDVAGALRRDAADALGLSPDCLITVGTGDEHAAFVGAGALDPGTIGDVAGTAEPVGVSTSSPVTDPQALLETHCHALPDMWLIENPGFVSGGSVLWLSNLLGCSQTGVFELAATASEGSGDALFLPALNGSVAPRWDANARGAFAGLNLSHGRAEIARAVLEGCAFAVRDSVERLHDLGLGQRAMRVAGGGARAHGWLQIKADVTGLPVEVPRETEATTLGAAIIAAVAAGWHVDGKIAASVMVGEPQVVIEPRSEFRALYDDAYGRYRHLFDVLEPTFSDRAVAQ